MRKRERGDGLGKNMDTHDKQGRHGVKHKEANMETGKGKKTQVHTQTYMHTQRDTEDKYIMGT